MPSSMQARFPRQDWQRVWTDPEMRALPLMAAWMDRYPEESFEWTPLTWLMELQDDFDVTVPTPVFNRLCAARALLQGNEFFTCLPDFIRICNVLTTGVHMDNALDLANSHEITWGVTEAMLIVHPESEEQFEFHPEISAYIRTMLTEEGFVVAPPILVSFLDEPLPQASFDEFSEDVFMAQGMASAAQKRTEDLTYWLAEEFQEMVQQLLSLPMDREKLASMEAYLRKSGGMPE